MHIAAKLYDKYASPDQTKARRAQANGLVKMWNKPPIIHNNETQM